MLHVLFVISTLAFVASDDGCHVTHTVIPEIYIVSLKYLVQEVPFRNWLSMRRRKEHLSEQQHSKAA